MQGIYSKLPTDTLAAALAPIALLCAELEWAVDIQSGLFRYDREDCDRVLLPFLHRIEQPSPMQWFDRGILPRYADCLILDEWSYYLGFDSFKVSPKELARKLAGGRDPRPLMFELVIQLNLIYVVRVDTGWWEAYTPNKKVLRQLREGWGGICVDSDRWNAGMPAFLGHRPKENGISDGRRRTRR